jgi:hypothetical protein
MISTFKENQYFDEYDEIRDFSTSDKDIKFIQFCELEKENEELKKQIKALQEQLTLANSSVIKKVEEPKVILNMDDIIELHNKPNTIINRISEINSIIDSISYYFGLKSKPVEEPIQISFPRPDKPKKRAKSSKVVDSAGPNDEGVDVVQMCDFCEGILDL